MPPTAVPFTLVTLHILLCYMFVSSCNRASFYLGSSCKPLAVEHWGRLVQGMVQAKDFKRSEGMFQLLWERTGMGIGILLFGLGLNTWELSQLEWVHGLSPPCSFTVHLSNCKIQYRLMSSVWVWCNGCGRGFTPSGLSQHLSKTQNPCCHHLLIQSNLVLLSLPIAAY